MRRSKILKAIENGRSSESAQVEPLASSKDEQQQGDERPVGLRGAQDERHNKEDNFYDWDSWNPMSEDFHSTRNTLVLDTVEDPMSALTGQRPVDDSKIGEFIICDHFARYGNCADGEYCERIHADPKCKNELRALQNTIEINKNRTCLNATYLSPIELEPDNEALSLVALTDDKSPTNFHFVAPYETMNFKNYTREDLEFHIQHAALNSTSRQKLQKIHDQLAAIFEHSYRIDNVNDEIYLGQIVACKLKDGHYRRAMVTYVPILADDEYEYRLSLVDVGVEIELPREKIHDIKAQCLSEPPLAVNSCLDIRPVDGQVGWTKEAIEFFQTVTRSEQYFLCKVEDYILSDDMYVVDLYNIESNMSVSDMMIDEGLALRI